jgi:hypothetical protein
MRTGNRAADGTALLSVLANAEAGRHGNVDRLEPYMIDARKRLPSAVGQPRLSPNIDGCTAVLASISARRRRLPTMLTREIARRTILTPRMLLIFSMSV